MANAPTKLTLDVEYSVSKPTLAKGDKVRYYDPNTFDYINGNVEEVVIENNKTPYARVYFPGRGITQSIFLHFLEKVLPLPLNKEAAEAAFDADEADAIAAARADELHAAFPQYPGWRASNFQTKEEWQAHMNKTAPSEYEFVSAPEHYNGHPAGVECQEIIRECKDPMIAFAIKHLWRTQWGSKPGQSAEQDFAKAIEYIQLQQAKEAGVKRL
jgi:hypothetical protein